MKKILIVIAHPSSKSFSHTMAQRYESIALSAGNEVKVLDLYRDKRASSFVGYEDIEELKTHPQGTYFREFLSWADEYVFFFPVWWFDSPAILKNFFDASFISGFGYKYVNHDNVGLLNDKAAKVFVTSDGPAWAYHWGFVPLVSSWKWRLSYCGINIKRVCVLGKKRWQSDAYCEKWMQTNLDKAVLL